MAAMLVTQTIQGKMYFFTLFHQMTFCWGKKKFCQICWSLRFSFWSQVLILTVKSHVSDTNTHFTFALIELLFFSFFFFCHYNMLQNIFTSFLFFLLFFLTFITFSLLAVPMYYISCSYFIFFVKEYVLCYKGNNGLRCKNKVEWRKKNLV